MAHPFRGGERKFRYGLDDAPHWCKSKLADKPASGVFSMLIGPALTAAIFEEAGCLDKLADLLYEI